jgi:hypothetical protein
MAALERAGIQPRIPARHALFGCPVGSAALRAVEGLHERLALLGGEGIQEVEGRFLTLLLLRRLLRDILGVVGIPGSDLRFESFALRLEFADLDGELRHLLLQPFLRARSRPLPRPVSTVTWERRVEGAMRLVSGAGSQEAMEASLGRFGELRSRMVPEGSGVIAPLLVLRAVAEFHVTGEGIGGFGRIGVLACHVSVFSRFAHA